MNKEKYWTPFILAISKKKKGEIFSINSFWRKAGGGSYTTICYYLRRLNKMGYLQKFQRGYYRINITIPKNLKLKL